MVGLLLAVATMLGAGSYPAGLSQQAVDDLVPEVVTQDLDGDGEVEAVVIYRDADGQAVKAEADSNNDGRADMWAVYSVDAEGTPSAELTIDTNGDGMPDAWYWREGDLLVRVGRDTRGDGRADAWSILNAHGAVVEVQGDTDADGAVDTWSTVLPNGITSRTAYDTTGDGRPDRWITFDASGAVETIETDTDGDGTPDKVVRR